MCAAATGSGIDNLQNRKILPHAGLQHDCSVRGRVVASGRACAGAECAVPVASDLSFMFQLRRLLNSARR